MSGEGVLSSRGGAEAQRVSLRPMSDAPKTGERLLLWCRHTNWKYAADDDDRDRWEGFVIASWTDYNGGGWTWHGHCGEFLGWLPLPTPVLPDPAPRPEFVKSNAGAFIAAVHLAATLYSDVELAFWLTAPQPLCDMWTPVQMLARGEAQVLLGRLQALDEGVYL